jgi:cytochrome c551/c552
MQRTRRSSERNGARPGVVRGAFALVATLALLLQAFVVQTHTHAFSAPIVVATEAQAGAHAEDTSVPHHKSGCILCQALAHSVQALTPSTAQVAALTGATYETAALALRRAPRALSHTWRSRAPPISL